MALSAPFSKYRRAVLGRRTVVPLIVAGRVRQVAPASMLYRHVPLVPSRPVIAIPHWLADGLVSAWSAYRMLAAPPVATLPKSEAMETPVTPAVPIGSKRACPIVTVRPSAGEPLLTNRIGAFLKTTVNEPDASSSTPP